MNDKLKRQEYLQAVIQKYRTSTPELSLKDFVEVLLEEFDDKELIKEIKKQEE